MPEIPPLPDEAHEQMEHYRDYHMMPGYPYTAEITALLASRPSLEYFVRGATPAGHADDPPGFSIRYWLDAPGGPIREEVKPWNSYYARLGAGPESAGVELAPFPPEEEV
jgi:hypothetical protein